MRCPACKAYVPYDAKLRTCAACGAPLTKKPFLEDLLNMVAESSAEKNFIFWGLAALIVGLIAGGLEFWLGKGDLMKYYEDSIFYSLVLFIYWGFIIELIAKINAQIRIASRTVILKERRVLRVFRMGTNLVFLAGMAVSMAWIGPDNFFRNFPAFTLITTTTVCVFWAIEGMVFREDHFQDARVRNFFLLIGVRHPHPYRVVSAWFLAGVTLALATYSILWMFPSIFWGYYNSWVVQSTIKFVNSFLAYLPI